MGNIARQFLEVGAAQAAPLAGFAQGFMDQQERMRQVEEAGAKLQMLKQEHEAEMAAKQQKSAMQQYGLQQGDMRAKVLGGDFAGAAKASTAMNPARSALGLPPLEGMTPSKPIMAPNLKAVGPFDPTLGHPRPKEQTGVTFSEQQKQAMRGYAGIEPKFENANGDIWDATSGQYVGTLPMTGAREKMAAAAAIAADRNASADRRADAALVMRQMAMMLSHQDRQAAGQRAYDLEAMRQGFRREMDAEGAQRVGRIFQQLGEDGKNYLWTMSKEGVPVQVTHPKTGVPMLAPVTGKQGSAALDAGDLEDDLPRKQTWSEWWNGVPAGGVAPGAPPPVAPKPSPSAPPPAGRPAAATPLPTATPAANAAHRSATAAVPGLVVTSVKRSAKRNEEVGGVPNSHHLTGGAVDYVMPGGRPPTRREYIAVRNAVAKDGYKALLHSAGSGMHIHIEPDAGARAKPGQSAAPKKAAGAAPSRSDRKAQQEAGRALADELMTELGF